MMANTWQFDQLWSFPIMINIVDSASPVLKLLSGESTGTTLRDAKNTTT